MLAARDVICLSPFLFLLVGLTGRSLETKFSSPKKQIAYFLYNLTCKRSLKYCQVLSSRNRSFIDCRRENLISLRLLLLFS